MSVFLALIAATLLGIFLHFAEIIPRSPPSVPTHNESIKTLARQASRWAIAANQDENPVIRVLHANYGAGYLWAIQDIATSEEFTRATGREWREFRNGITDVQDRANRQLLAICPAFPGK